MKILRADNIKKEYLSLWNTMEINPKSYPTASYISHKIFKYKEVYQKTCDIIPFFILGFFHYINTDNNFFVHIHNGDSLNERTINEPKNRPIKGYPPFSWKESVEDFIEYISPLPENWDLENTFYFIEKTDNFSYRRKEINTPILWSGSNHYSSGYINNYNMFTMNIIYEKIGLAVLLKYSIDHDIVSLPFR